MFKTLKSKTVPARNKKSVHKFSDPILLNGLSTYGWRTFGADDVAYIKPTESKAGVFYRIHAGDGTLLAEVADLDIAVATIRQNDMEAVQVH